MSDSIKEAIETVQDMLDVMEASGSCYAYKHNGGEDRLRNVLDCLRAQQEQESSEPLTLDELRQMDGEPVFLVDLVHKSDPKIPPLWDGWIVFTKHDQNGFIPRGGGFFSNDGYGKHWLAYRRKPEEGTK